MKFKGYDNFIAEQYRPLNESKEKFKVTQAKPSHTSSEGAFTVKFIGESFDMQTMVAFLQSDPISAPALQKVKTMPDQYFFIYKTIKGGDPRFLAPNSRIWITYLELINAKVMVDGSEKPVYVGFNKPPYNNFVKWTNVDNLINKQEPEVIATGKNIVSSVANQGTQQADAELSDTEKSIAANAQQFAKTGQIPGSDKGTLTQNGDPAIEKIIDGFKGISMGSRGPKVDQLQNTIQKLADYTHNTNASKENKLNVRPGGEFDDIFGVHTAKALQTVLGLDSEPDVIDADIIDKMKQAFAGVHGITAAELTDKAKFPVVKGKVLAGKPPAPAANTPVAPVTTAPTATPNNVEAQSAKAPTRVIKDTLIGNIRY